MEFSYFSIWYNVNIYMVITQKMIWEPIKFGSFLEKIYLRLHENALEISEFTNQRYKQP